MVTSSRDTSVEERRGVWVQGIVQSEVGRTEIELENGGTGKREREMSRRASRFGTFITD